MCIRDSVHRIPNGPVHRGSTLRWPLDAILAGIDEGLRKAAHAAPEGIASIAVDAWGVDYVRLDPSGSALSEPFCYRDERTVTTKSDVDALIPPLELFARTGVLPHLSLIHISRRQLRRHCQRPAALRRHHLH